MKLAIISRVLVAFVVVTTLMAVGYATDLVWDGNSVYQYPSTPGGWDLPNNWVANDNYPLNGNDNVTLADVSTTATCTFNLVDRLD